MKECLLGIVSYDAKIDVGNVPFLMACSEYCDFHSVIHRPTDVARNQLVTLAQQRSQNLIMVDSDAIVPPGAIKSMVERIREEECVVGLPYCSAGGGICVGELSPSVKVMESYSGWREEDNLGTHCIGYNIKVFGRIGKPYFEYEYNSDRTSLRGWAEDTVLHRKLVKAGIRLYCDWGIWADHVVRKVMIKPRSLTETDKMLIMMSE